MAVWAAGLAVIAIPLLSPRIPPRSWDVEIAPGVFLPFVNLGHPDDNTSVVEDVALWLTRGGVGLDTALIYKNQRQVSLGVEKAGKALADVFVTTKIPCSLSSEAALAYVREDLRELRAMRVDLMLMHFPCEGDVERTQATWRGLQEAAARGWARAIGVSNFKAEDISAVLALGGTPPAVNQCRFSVGDHDDALLDFCRTRNITYEAYSPLRHVNLRDKTLQAIAERHSKSPAQVALRWVVQQGVPLATSPGGVDKFVLDDLELDTFALTQAEMKLLSTLAKS